MPSPLANKSHCNDEGVEGENDVHNDILQWLRDALHSERLALNLILEERHESLITECAISCFSNKPTSPSGISTEELPLDESPPLEKTITFPESSESQICIAAATGSCSSAFKNVKSGDEDSDIGGIMHATTTANARGRRPSVFSDHKEEKQRQEARWLYRLATSEEFEVTFAFLILASCIVLALECQYQGHTLGYDIAYPGFDETADETFPGMDWVFIIIDIFLGISFTLELVIKLSGLGFGFVYNAWNFFDTVIVVGWLADVFLRNLSSMPSIFRMARLARLLRLMKLIKTLSSLDHLFLMTTTLKGSMTVLFWAFVLMLALQTMAAFLINQIVVSYYFEGEGNAEKREVFKYFGTFSRATFTMFEITLGNWAPPSRVLLENVNEWFMLLTVLIKLIVGFAIVGIINGIFIQETFKVAETDDHLLLMQKERTDKNHFKKMKRFFEMADTSKDGLLSQEEFVTMLKDDTVRMWMAAQGLDAGSDIDTVFELLSHGRAHLTPLDFVTGVSKLKGVARSIDIQVLLRHHDYTQQQCHDLQMKVQEVQNALNSQQDQSLPRPRTPQDGASEKKKLPSKHMALSLASAQDRASVPRNARHLPLSLGGIKGRMAL
jgi:hypothetical protein